MPIELNAQFDESDFVKKVYNDEYVIIVGSEVILNDKNEKFKSVKGDINKYVVSKLNIQDTRYDSPLPLCANGECTPSAIRKIISSIEYNKEDTAPELRRFISSKLFKLVLTTTTDCYMEKIMDDVWGEQVWRKCDLMNDKESVDELQDELKNQYIRKPTLLYLFGQAQKNSRNKFVSTDIEAIKQIHNWIARPEIAELKEYLTNKHLLAIGCKFDNWYFRFLWFILKGGVDDRMGDGEVAISWKPSESDENLQLYLDRALNVAILPDARSFMDDISKKLTSLDEANPYRDYIISRRKKGGVFLSYNSPDISVVRNIFQTIYSNGYKVWFDVREINGGDPYGLDISNAIAESKVFIPIISPKIADGLAANSLNATENYFVKEWEWARQNESIKVIPLLINGASKNALNLFNQWFYGNNKEIENTKYCSGRSLTEVGAWGELLNDISQIMVVD